MLRNKNSRQTKGIESLKGIRDQCNDYNQVVFNGKTHLKFTVSLSLLYLVFHFLLFTATGNKEVTKVTSFKWLTIHSSTAWASPGNLLEMQILGHASQMHWIRCSLVCMGVGVKGSIYVSTSPLHDPETHSSWRTTVEEFCMSDLLVELLKNLYWCQGPILKQGNQNHWRWGQDTNTHILEIEPKASPCGQKESVQFSVPHIGDSGGLVAITKDACEERESGGGLGLKHLPSSHYGCSPVLLNTQISPLFSSQGNTLSCTADPTRKPILSFFSFLLIEISINPEKHFLSKIIYICQMKFQTLAKWSM